MYVLAAGPLESGCRVPWVSDSVRGPANCNAPSGAQEASMSDLRLLPSLVLGLAFAFAAAGCSSDTTSNEVQATKAHQEKVTICHVAGNGKRIEITIGAPGAANHLKNHSQDWRGLCDVEPLECPSKGDLTTAAEILPDLLPDPDTLWEWQTFMVGLGLRLPANEPLAKWHDFLAAKLEGFGLDVVREPVSVGEWYDHRAWSLTLLDNGKETNVPVASYYPYSGQTPEGGVVGELADAGLGGEEDFDEGDFTGKIALIEQPRFPVPIAALANPSYVYDPDNNVDLMEPYDRASIAFLAPQVESPALARDAGAVAAIIALDYSPGNAAGQFTPFQDPPQGIPTVYVDQPTGAMLRERVAQGATVRLELLVDIHESGITHDIIATLPGRSSDEIIIVNTHTDGTSSAEENGGIAVLALAQYLSSLPDVCRDRTFIFVLTPGHFYYDLEDTQRFIDRHPEIIEKSVGSLTTEHLGQMEWLDDEMGYHATGLPELSVLYGSDTPVQSIGENAVIAEDLRRTIGSRPLAGGRYSGVGRQLNMAGVPNLAYLTGPNAMLSWGERTGENAYTQNLDKTDRDRMHQEIRTFARLATSLDGTPAEVLCEGMCRDTMAP